MTLTNAKVVKAVAGQTSYPKNLSSEMIEILWEIIKGTLESGEDVLVGGFRFFSVKDKHERRGRNPSTGDDMMLYQKLVVTFRCSLKLRDKIIFTRQHLCRHLAPRRLPRYSAQHQ